MESRKQALWALGETGRTGPQVGIFRSRFHDPNSYISLPLWILLLLSHFSRVWLLKAVWMDVSESPLLTVSQCCLLGYSPHFPQNKTCNFHTLLFFWLCCTAHGISVLPPGTDPVAPALDAQNLNHWTSRKSHHIVLFFKKAAVRQRKKRPCNFIYMCNLKKAKTKHLDTENRLTIWWFQGRHGGNV